MNLLQSFGVSNVVQFINKKSDLEKEISEKESELRLIKESDGVRDYSHERVFLDKSNPHYCRAEMASITGDTVGDPLKDTSGPSLNILIKLSSILSVVFSPLFLNTSYFA